MPLNFAFFDMNAADRVMGDGKATVSRASQQRQAAEAVAEFTQTGD